MDHFPTSFWEHLSHAELLPKLVELAIQPTAAQISYLVDIIEARWGNPEFIVHLGLYHIEAADLAAVTDELRRLERYDLANVRRKMNLVL